MIDVQMSNATTTYVPSAEFHIRQSVTSFSMSNLKAPYKYMQI